MVGLEWWGCLANGAEDWVRWVRGDGMRAEVFSFEKRRGLSPAVSVRDFGKGLLKGRPMVSGVIEFSGPRDGVG